MCLREVLATMRINVGQFVVSVVFIAAAVIYYLIHDGIIMAVPKG